ncbi:MAG: molybdenum ABC transporter ATP-binding protein [Pseudomonadota bacterium]
MSLSVQLEHRFADFRLDVRFDAPHGVTALLGRSGSGKTSVVNAVAGLLRPHLGQIRLGGQTLSDTQERIWVPAHRRRMGYVFQEGRLFPHMNVRQNLRYGLRVRRTGTRFDEVVELLGLGALLHRAPETLSGGERQRVAIGRALLSDPRALLMDEPLAALDNARKDDVLPYLEALRDRADIPILYVSHAVSEVARLATTVVMLDAGRVLRRGPAVEVLSDPGAVPGFGVRAAGSVLTGRISEQHPDGLTEVAVSAGRMFLPRVDAERGTALRIRVAAQDVILARERPEGLSALNILPARVVSLRRGEGPGMMVQVKAGDDRLLARITQRSAQALELAAGAECYLVIKTVAVSRADVGQTAPGR